MSTRTTTSNEERALEPDQQTASRSVSRRDLLATSAKVGLGMVAGATIATQVSTVEAAPRRNGIVEFTITDASWSAGTSGPGTVTLSFAPGGVVPPVGALASVAGTASSGPGSFNGEFIITAASASSLSYSLKTNPGKFSGGGSVAVIEFLPDSTNIKDLGLSADESKLLTPKAAKLTRGQLKVLATGKPGMTKLKLSVKDVTSISKAFDHVSARLTGMKCSFGCCCSCWPCSCCTLVGASLFAEPNSVDPAASTSCCCCCTCIKFNFSSTSSAAHRSGHIPGSDRRANRVIIP